jgi:hypothetical protein
MPAYLALAEGAAAQRTSFLLVCDCDRERTRAFLQQWQVALPVAIAPIERHSFFHDYCISSTPSYCLITPEGSVQQSGRADDTLADWRHLVKPWSRRVGGGRAYSDMAEGIP